MVSSRMPSARGVLSVTVCLLAAIPASAAPSIDYKTARFSRKVEAVRAIGPINIDGKLDEDAWRDAPVAKNFTQSEPSQGEPATFDAEVKVLYDDDSIYFGVFNRD